MNYVIVLSYFIRVLVAMVLVLRTALVKLDTPVKVTVASVPQDSLDRSADKVMSFVTLSNFSYSDITRKSKRL